MNIGLYQQSDTWGAIKSWDQYEKCRLDKLREQRERMKNMKDVIEQYSQIIIQLQAKNRVLVFENEQLKQRLNSFDAEAFEGYRLSRKYEDLCLELQKEKKIRENCQITMQNLRKELTLTDYSSLPALKPIQTRQLLEDYNVLQELYNQLKDEIFVVQKQNLQLKQVIREQSKLSYEKDVFWKKQKKSKKQDKQNIEESRDKTLSPSKNSRVVKISSKNDQKIASKLQQSLTKVKELQIEVKKQEEIIQKLKQAEDMQLKLIDKIKCQKSKICICHSHGGSSKKVVSSAGLVSFKKDSIVQQ